jgi:uncharacterized protein (DUF1501 family)
MKDLRLPDRGRRELLRRGAGFGLLHLLSTPTLLSLAGIGSAAAQTAGDYKAIVCILLDGGNDGFNTLVPFDAASNARYRTARGSVALTTGLQALTPMTAQPDNRRIALHPRLAGLKPIFDAGRLAIIASCGPLVEPVTLQTLNDGSARLPRDLFSHEQQALAWQQVVNNGAVRGWGARIADSVVDLNTFAAASAISTAGNAPFLAGNLVTPFVVGSSGDVGSIAGAGDRLDRATGFASGRANLLEQSYAAAHDRLRDGASTIANAILPTSAVPAVPDVENGLALQLQTVARLIGGRNALGARRQVFWCRLNGFDTHNDQLARHDDLMRLLGDALVYFDQTLGALGVRDQVALFTASDFGRNLVANDGGTDHGWGSHSLVMGGAVNGRDIYGSLPNLQAGTTDIWRDNYIIPKIASDQIGGSLGRWFGLDDAALRAVFPALAIGFGSLVVPGALPLLRA